MPIYDNRTDDIKRLEDAGGGLVKSIGARFGSTQDALYGTANQTDIDEQLEEGRGNANSTFDSLSGSLGRSQRALGLQLSDRQQASQSRKLGLARSIAMADTSGSIRRGSFDRSQQAFAAGGAFEDQLEGIQHGGLAQLANAQGREISNNAARKAQKKAGTGQLAGLAVGAMMMMSSRSVKDPKGKVSILDKLNSLPVERWAYKGDEADHIGTYAEDFNDAFGVNQDRRGVIDVVDAIGVVMGGVKELNEKLEAYRSAK